MLEMEEQAKPENDNTFPDRALVRLNQFVVHRVNPIQKEGMGTFCKITFSKDKYNLIGNSVNPLLDYNWELRPRSRARNVPQESKP